MPYEEEDTCFQTCIRKSLPWTTAAIIKSLRLNTKSLRLNTTNVRSGDCKGILTDSKRSRSFVSFLMLVFVYIDFNFICFDRLAAFSRRLAPLIEFQDKIKDLGAKNVKLQAEVNTCASRG